MQDFRSDVGSEAPPGRPRGDSVIGQGGAPPTGGQSKEEQAALDTLWKQVMEPVLEYCQVR